MDELHGNACAYSVLNLCDRIGVLEKLLTGWGRACNVGNAADRHCVSLQLIRTYADMVPLSLSRAKNEAFASTRQQ